MKRIRNIGSAIEPNIKPLCDALNRIESVRTYFSCQGHFWRGLPPYVLFDADTAAAAALEKELREDSRSQSPKLRAPWQMTGWFSDTFKLRFRLDSPIYNRKTGSWLCFAFREKVLKRDFVVLTEMVENLHDRFLKDKEQNHRKHEQANPHV